jgi:hypothetical protein
MNVGYKNLSVTLLSCNFHPKLRFVKSAPAAYDKKTIWAEIAIFFLKLFPFFPHHYFSQRCLLEPYLKNKEDIIDKFNYFIFKFCYFNEKQMQITALKCKKRL